MTTVLDYPMPTAFVVSEAMFGGNDLFKYNWLSGPKASFPDAANTLGLSSLRYPGGSMTESDFDVFHPDGPPLNAVPGAPYVGITEFLNFASASERPVTITLPTAKMYAGQYDANSSSPREIQQTYLDAVLSYVRNLLTHDDRGGDALPNVPISAFELGNEYWGAESGNMTGKEYGRLVNTLAPALADLFNEILGPGAPHPQILVQMGSPWGRQYSDGIYSSLVGTDEWAHKIQISNHDIIDQITDPNAITAISGLIEHYYYNEHGTALPQTSQAVQYIDADFSQWAAAGYANANLFITEWGVDQHNTAQFGLKAASVLIEQMEHMLAMGVDAAFAWPVQGWETALAGSTDSDPVLSPAGAAFKLMVENLVGTTLLAGEPSGGPLEVDTFASDRTIIFYVMSRSETSQRVDLDVSKMVGEFTLVDGTKIGISGGLGVNDPSAPALLTHYSASDIGIGSTMHFTLTPFEVMQVIFKMPWERVYSGTAGDDAFSGSSGNDKINGAEGNDSLVGGMGNDIVQGSKGRDLLSGWDGNDSMLGGPDDDKIYAQQGNDSLFGGQGNDYLSASTGNDRLWGSTGNDALYGGDGDDSLYGGDGSDTLFGGLDHDSFVFQKVDAWHQTVDKIADFQSGSDTISLNHNAFAGLTTGSIASISFVANSTGQAEVSQDRIIYDKATGWLWFDRDGSNGNYAPVAFASVQPDATLVASDLSVF